MVDKKTRVMIVEDDGDLAQAIASLVRPWSTEVIVVGCVRDAIEKLQSSPGLIITDVRLPDGSGVSIAEAACRLQPMPAVVAISGQATPEEGFKLALAGVRGYVTKPLVLETFRETLRAAIAWAPQLAPLAAIQVGHRPLQDVQSAVRKAMAAQALALAQGNRTDAAKMLHVSRQAIQQMIRDLDLE
jgi:two-component system, response regulator RegA